MFIVQWQKQKHIYKKLTEFYKFYEENKNVWSGK